MNVRESYFREREAITRFGEVPLQLGLGLLLALPAKQKTEKDRVPWMTAAAGPEIIALKHESRILGQWSNPVSR